MPDVNFWISKDTDLEMEANVPVENIHTSAVYVGGEARIEEIEVERRGGS